MLTPEDLLPSVYMCLNRIAPAYEGKELGIGEMVLMKAIAQSTGRSLQVIANILFVSNGVAFRTLARYSYLDLELFNIGCFTVSAHIKSSGD